MNLNKQDKGSVLIVNFEDFTEMQIIKKKGGYTLQLILGENRQYIHRFG